MRFPAVRELLKAFTDLAGAVIAAGALHTQSDTARAITGRHAGYVMTVKANMPALCKQLEKLPWTVIPAHGGQRRGSPRRARHAGQSGCQRTRPDAAPAHRVHRFTDPTARTGDVTAPEFTTLPYPWLPAGYLATADHLTLSDREVPGERAKSRSARLSVCWRDRSRRAISGRSVEPRRTLWLLEPPE